MFTVTSLNACEDGRICQLLLTRQSVHVDALGGQADAHVPARQKRRKTIFTVNFVRHDF